MKGIISRTYNKNETLGSFLIMEGEKTIYKCKTIELAWNGNQHNTSCIPESTYDVVKYNSPTKGECFHVKDVKDRDSILIHIGDYAAGEKVDTMGCILPGSHFEDINNDGNIDVVESTKTLKELLEILPDTFKLYIL
jgi:hypothetical protein